MAGETVSTEALCLRIVPWSRTSHVVTWLTPRGPLATVVKGAVRPKSVFLGQYDLNYTCELVYYARAHGELHALRECTPTDGRERLRSDYRALVLAEHFRHLAEELAPAGPEAEAWYDLLADALSRLARGGQRLLAELLAYELAVLRLAGLDPEIEAESGAFALRGERRLPVSHAVAACLRDPRKTEDPQILLDAARVIGIFYSFHVETAPDVRRVVLQTISTNEAREGLTA